jgi:DNA-binding XRE family transcriptional regulator
MPRPPRHLDSVVAAVRAHFSLTQQELAAWLSVSEAQAGHLETGRRGLSGAAAEALAPLVAALPPPTPPANPPGTQRLASIAPAPALAPPEAAPLEARLDYCQHHARRVRRQLAPLQAQAAQAARWLAALPALRAALPPDPGPTAQPDPATDWPAWQVWHRRRWLDQRPTALPPDLSARYHLLRLRAEALEAEAAALAALLPPGPLA